MGNDLEFFKIMFWIFCQNAQILFTYLTDHVFATCFLLIDHKDTTIDVEQYRGQQLESICKEATH